MKKHTIRWLVILLSAVIFVSPALSVSAATPPKVYQVATGHLDTVWNWPIDTTISNYLPGTVNKNLSLFAKYPNYKFNFEGGFRYALLKEYYPDLFNQVKTAVAGNRWYPVGAVWENGDVNVPSPEALMRNILYGNKFFEKEFGVVNTDLFLPDCFGFAYSLPTIASHMGLTSFSSAKLIWSDVNYLPFDVGVWKGVDNSSVIATLNPGKYGSGVSSSLSSDQSLATKIMGYYNGRLGASDTARMMKYYGSGSDQGGAADEANIQNLENAIAANGSAGSVLNVISAYSSQAADEMTQSEKDALSTYTGELQLKFHGNATFTGEATSKYLNRKNEQLADAAERASVAAMWMGVKDYPMEKLTDAWKRVVAAQHHDNLTGTSIQAVYVDAINDYITALNQFAEEFETSAGSVIAEMNTKVASGVPVVVSNAVSSDRNEPVECTVNLSAPAQHVRVYTKEGQEVPSQVISVTGNQVKLVFLASVASNGYSTYNVVPASSPCAIDTGLKVTQSTLENSRYKVTINDNGDISSIFDKANSKEVLSAPITLEQFTNSNTNYGAWEITYSDVVRGPDSAVGPANQKVTVTENGPVRVALKIDRTHNSSSYSQTVTLTAGDSADRVDVNNKVMFAERAAYVKASFPVTVSNPNATYDLGIGTIQRDNNDENQYEFPAQQWADLTNQDNSYGVTIMNDSKYGWDKPDNNTLRLTLFHVPQEDRAGNSKQSVRDFGENRFVYSIMGHTGDWRNGGSQYEAAKLNQPLTAFQTSSHEGALESRLSFASLNTEAVMIKAMKRAEESNEIIVRVNELYGQPQTGVTLSMGNGIKSFRAVNGYETPVADSTASLVDGKLIFDIGGYSPKTFAVTLNDYGSAVARSSYQAVSLDNRYNADIFSFSSDTSDGGFGPSQYTMAAELVPADSKTVAGGVPFTFGPVANGRNNAVKAAGQSIPLPAGTTKVYLLAGTQRYDKEFTFRLGSAEATQKIQSMWDYVGGWDQYGSGRYGGIKRDPIGYLSDHIYDPTGVMYYDRSYLFKYEISVPAGATELTLPDDGDLMIAAVTAQTNVTNPAESISELYPSKQPSASHTLTVTDGSGSSVYHCGNPVQVTYTGAAEGDVIWTGSDGSVYTGYSVFVNMPDYDLTLTPAVTPYSANLALNRSVTCSSEISSEPGSKAVDGSVEDNSKWCATGSGDKWLTVDLGEYKVFDTYILKNAGNGGENTRWNTADFKIQIQDAGGSWVTVDSVFGNKLDVYAGKIRPVYTRYVRLYITKPTTASDSAARIYEFGIYNNTTLGGDLVISNPAATADVSGTANIALSAYNTKAGKSVTVTTKVIGSNNVVKFTKSDAVSLDASGWKTYALTVDFSAVLNRAATDRLEVVVTDADGKQISDTVTIKNLGIKVLIDGFSVLQAEKYTAWSGGNLKVESSTTDDGTTIQNIGATYPDAWIGYSVVDFGSGVNTLSIRYANNSGRCKSDASIEVRLGSADGTLAGIIPIPATGGAWSNYGTAIGRLTQTVTGEQNVYLVMRGTTPDGNPYIANFDYFQFSLS